MFIYQSPCQYHAVLCREVHTIDCRTGLGSDSGDGVQVGLDVSLFKLHGEFKGRLGQNIQPVWVGPTLHQLLSHSHLQKHDNFICQLLR